MIGCYFCIQLACCCFLQLCFCPYFIHFIPNMHHVQHLQSILCALTWGSP
jgi:hypothetical protein